jgi:hypothetical protein
MSRDFTLRLSVQSAAGASEARIEGKTLVVLQVNYRSVYNTVLEFWNLMDPKSRCCYTCGIMP